MKIAQVVAAFPPYMSGTGNVCYHYAIELARLGHEVTVFTGNYPDEPYEYPPEIKVVRLKSLFRIGNAPFLPGLLRIKDYDIIHLHYPFFFGSELVYIVSKLRGIKYVLSYHNDTIAGGIFGLYFKLYNATIMNLVLSGAQKLIVSSIDYGRNSFLASYADDGKGKLIEIPFGVDLTRFNDNAGSDKFKKSLGLQGKKTVLFVGGLDKAHYFKGVEYLIQSFAKIKSDNARLLIVGDGDLKEGFKKLAEEEGVGDKTIFAGKVSDDDLSGYYGLSDIVVLPSIAVESFGLVLIEAMAMGKPVIASNLPGVRTVVDNGVNGFLVEPKNVQMLADKLKQLLSDDKQRISFGEKGKEKVKSEYSWGVIGKKIENILVNIH